MAVSKPPPDSTSPILSGSNLLRLTVVVAFGPFLAQLDTSVVNVALPALATDLGTPLATAQWVSTGYLLALALMIPLSGWLVDSVGAKRVYIACFAAFTAASAGCCFAANIEQLIAFRIVQGMAGGLLAPMAQMLIARHAGPRMTKMMAMIGVPILVGPIFGPSIAGGILSVGSWRWLFVLNLPIGILAIALAATMLPADATLRPRRLDVIGFLSVSPGLVLLLDGLHRLTTSDNTALVGAEVFGGVALLVFFVRRSLQQGNASLINLRLLSGRTFSASASTQFLANATSQGGQFLIPLYMILGTDRTPAEAGLLLAAMGIGMLASRPTVDPLIRNFGPRRTSVGGGMICLLATLPFAISGVTLPAAVIVLLLFIRGFGLGITNLPSAVSAYSSIPAASLTHAATAINIAQRLGGPVAVMTIALLLQQQSGAMTNAISAGAFPGAFQLLCVINICCMIAAMRLPLRMP